jgi:hypothetical protein
MGTLVRSQTYPLQEGEVAALSACERGLTVVLALDYVLQALAQDFRPWAYMVT